jgi:hypothetical protein
MPEVDWEQDWLRALSPVHLFARAGRLGIARTKAGRRGLRLLACALCRSAWHLFGKDDWAAIEAVERYADGVIRDKELDEANSLAANRLFDLGADRPFPNESSYRSLATPGMRLARAVFWATSLWNVRRIAENVYADVSAVCNATIRVAAFLIHCILDNPYRPLIIPRTVLAWNAGTVLALARAIDEKRNFQDMGILADALEDAGCSDAAVLAHCRGSGPHAHGCHVLEAILRGAQEG